MSQELVNRKPPVVAQLTQGYRIAVDRVISDLEEKGLLGEHPLVTAPALQTTVSGGVIGKMSGSFFLGSGNMSGGLVGEIRGEPMLTFAWNPPESDEMYTVGIPASKLVMRKRKAVEPDQPATTLQLIFNLPHFVRINEANLRRNPVRAFETVEYDRPDHYIIPGALREAIIWASDEDFAQLRNLGFGLPFRP